jgi:Domain of unknown function (DUF4168)
MQKSLRNTFMLSLAVGLIGLGFSSLILAQELQEKANVSDQDLKAFAKAYVEVDKIRLAYEPSLRNARDPEQLQNIQREATVKMEKAVEDQGLTREAYVRIFNSVKDDVELRKKTLKLIQEEQEKS